jgi:pyrophosphatase PpaX
MIDTILFDLDGTLLDTNELIIASFVHAFKVHQVDEISREYIIQHMGKPLVEQMVLFSGKNEVDEIIHSYRTFNLQQHDEMVKLFPHVKEVLQALKAQGIRLGVVTSKVRYTVGLGLRLFDLDSLFSSIVTSDEVTHPKPHPESVLLALKQLGSNPETALMVGDSQYDLLAARDAGVRSVGVAWSLQGESSLRKFNPAFMLQDMRDLLEIVAGEVTLKQTLISNEG